MAKRTSAWRAQAERALSETRAQLADAVERRDAAGREITSLTDLQRSVEFIESLDGESEVIAPSIDGWLSSGFVTSGRRFLLDGEHRQDPFRWMGSRLQRYSEALIVVTEAAYTRWGDEAVDEALRTGVWLEEVQVGAPGNDIRAAAPDPE